MIHRAFSEFTIMKSKHELATADVCLLTSYRNIYALFL